MDDQQVLIARDCHWDDERFTRDLPGGVLDISKWVHRRFQGPPVLHGERRSVDCLVEACVLVVVDYRREHTSVFPLTFAAPTAEPPAARPQTIQPAFAG